MFVPVAAVHLVELQAVGPASRRQVPAGPSPRYPDPACKHPAAAGHRAVPALLGLAQAGGCGKPRGGAPLVFRLSFFSPARAVGKDACREEGAWRAGGRSCPSSRLEEGLGLAPTKGCACAPRPPCGCRRFGMQIWRTSDAALSAGGGVGSLRQGQGAARPAHTCPAPPAARSLLGSICTLLRALPCKLTLTLVKALRIRNSVVAGVLVPAAPAARGGVSGGLGSGLLQALPLRETASGRPPIDHRRRHTPRAPEGFCLWTFTPTQRAQHTFLWVPFSLLVCTPLQSALHHHDVPITPFSMST